MHKAEGSNSQTESIYSRNFLFYFKAEGSSFKAEGCLKVISVRKFKFKNQFQLFPSNAFVVEGYFKWTSVRKAKSVHILSNAFVVRILPSLFPP
jgi:hypothetical protein